MYIAPHDQPASLNLDPGVLLEKSIIKGMVKVRREKPYLAFEEGQETLFFNELCKVLKRTL